MNRTMRGKTVKGKMLIVALLLVVFLTACSSGGTKDPGKATPTPAAGGTSSPAATEEKHDPVTLRMATWNDTYQELYDMFHQKYPWITVEPVFPADGDLMATIKANDAANTPIDLTWIIEMAPFLKDDMLEDLNPYMAKDESLKNKQFDPGFLENFDINGKRFAAPFVYVPTFLTVNLDMLQKHGLEMPKNDWTLEEFREMAKKATDPAAREYGLAYNSLWGLHFMSAVAVANGSAPNTSYMNADWTQSVMNTPAVLDDIKWMQGFVTKDGSLASVKKGTELGLDIGSDFLKGKSLFDFGGDWVLPILEKSATFKWDILPIPKGKVKQVTHGMIGALGINKASKHKDEAYLWISFQYEMEAQKWKIDHGAMASVKDDELLNYYSQSPMWQGRNADALKHISELACCVDMTQKLPAFAEYPWSLAYEVIMGEFKVEEIIPRIELFNKRTMEVRKELGW
ncbi:ABC transporter substrate-binding protein [Paenibacillus eucommiae]|uniref:ABC-type glycerol-3-phosphate transport system substrate-binding protein n=1 Tax=Paenibacillus eucommiae TaxID=1355755 RepID=A0ABS4J1A2_9BACL|nr:extracellular solute-binding protein [Paenibacillus eucommiae]MBP1993607.1 ABC-type glycerol-3-phosphate transport system substrate-binding protein [Paenibacillus eucommiae]